LADRFRKSRKNFQLQSLQARQSALANKGNHALNMNDNAAGSQTILSPGVSGLFFAFSGFRFQVCSKVGIV
jgi:hypothetical protein